MPEVPKIVHDRLRSGLPGGAASHPDPDVLAAFVEQALPAAEREGVLQHLAHCGDCREWTALSIPPLESGTQPVAAETGDVPEPVPSPGHAGAGRRPWFAWPGLRWGALAAGIAVASGILLMHPGKPSAVPEAKQPPASAATPLDQTVAAKKDIPSPHSALQASNSGKKLVAPELAIRRDNGSKLTDSFAGEPGNVVARGQVEASTANADMAKVATPAAAPTPPASPSEMVEVTAASGTVTTEEARTEPPVNGRQVANLADNGGAAAPVIISRAKAAKAESNEPSISSPSESLDKKQVTKETAALQNGAVTSLNATASNLAANTNQNAYDSAEPPRQWALHGHDLQRSPAAGAAWTTVLRSDRPLICYATAGNDIWAGGKAGDLFHSTDGGATWNQVHPLAQGQTLSDDVAHIDIRSTSEILLVTRNRQSWTTTDGGKSWVKK